MRPRSDHAHKWTLDPQVVFLNHGSFGACPRSVLEAQRRWQDRLEAEPVRFFLREWQAALDHARGRLAEFLGADESGLALVPNATAGVNAALRSFPVEAGDHLLTTSHAYNACKNALFEHANAHGAEVRVASIPFPIATARDAIAAILEAWTPKTKLLLLDHITSPTGLVLPAREIVEAMNDRGVVTLVDGAHAPGMIPLDLESLGAAWYTGNCHKWLCAPKGVAFLWTSPEWRERTRPAIISHGANMPAGDRSRYHLEFDWTGTHDPTGMLTLPDALDFMASLYPGGMAELMRTNRALVLEGRARLCGMLEIEAPAPEDMIGSLAAMPLPEGEPNPPSPLYADPLQERLFDQHRIQVPIGPWPEAPKRLMRISAQAHNHPADYAALETALREELKAEA